MSCDEKKKKIKEFQLLKRSIIFFDSEEIRSVDRM